MPVHTEDLEEFVKETTGVREEPVREGDEKMDTAGELTIGDLRTQVYKYYRYYRYYRNYRYYGYHRDCRNYRCYGYYRYYR